MRFLLGTSFFIGGPRNVRDLSDYWMRNLNRIDVQPAATVVIGEGGSFPMSCCKSTDRLTFIPLSGDLGNWQDVMTGKKANAHSGWSASVMTLAMLAYMNESDLIFKESDCLAFGPWVQQMYADLGDGDIVFGPKMKSAPWMACAQSLFLVRHSFIPQFVAYLLNRGPEKSEMELGEQRFAQMASKLPKAKVRYLSFPGDRERPIQWDAPVQYFQQPTQAELDEAQRRGLI